MTTRREIIKDVLNAFLSTDLTDEELVNEHFLGVVMDEEEIEILANAIDEALGKEVPNEDKN